MFFSKFIPAILLAAGLALEVSAHAGVQGALGVSGALARSDVKRPSNNAPCGAGVNIAAALPKSNAVRATGTTFTVTAQNFNGGADGSRKFTAKVDATGTGKSFVAATITKNGNGAPSNTGTEQLSVSLPAGTKCTGGAGKNTCVVSFVSSAGFGNCIAVQQGAAKREDILAASGMRLRRAMENATSGLRVAYAKRRLPSTH